jgi:hypothetical protein
MINDFSYERLKRLYASSLEAGFKPVIFGEEQRSNSKFILWRHDCDLEIPAIVRMAELEAEMGITSTYFLMLRSWFYNLLSPDGAALVRDLRALGHSVALHCDLMIARGEPAEDAIVENKVKEDFNILEVAYPSVFARVVSFHNPPDVVLRKDYQSFYSTYQEKFFSEIKYLSESNRIWRDEIPEKWFSNHPEKNYSILLHPEIWGYRNGTMRIGMEHFLEQTTIRFSNQLLHDDIDLK